MWTPDTSRDTAVLPQGHCSDGIFDKSTQQDYYGRQGGTLLHSYCTGTYSEVTVLFLWGNSAVTMEHPHSYFDGVPVWVLQGSIGVTSKKQLWYFSVGTSAVTA